MSKAYIQEVSRISSWLAVIGDMIVGIENCDGDTNVRFHQQDTQKGLFGTL